MKFARDGLYFRVEERPNGITTRVSEHTRYHRSPAAINQITPATRTLRTRD